MKNLKEYIVNENNFFKNLGIGKIKLIKEWLDEQGVKNYVINSDLTIDVDGNVNLRCYKEEQLPDYIQFRIVSNSFNIYHCIKLNSLKGCPKEVGGGFYCNNCSKLKSLEGCPQKIGGNFWCMYCSKLNTLKGCPQEVGGNFDCSECGKLFTEYDVEKMCKVKGGIYV